MEVNMANEKDQLIWITFQATKEQREKLERVAKQDNRTMSSWLRNVIDTAQEPEKEAQS